jgi:nucleoside-diphosphate-sugar epimerase
MTSSFASIDDLDQQISTPNPAVTGLLSKLTGPVMVIGAAGKMGWHLSLMLKQGLQNSTPRTPVITVSRFTTPASQEQFSRAGFEVISADASSPAEVAALPEATTVFFLAGIKFGTSGQPELLHRMNVVMPELVAERFRHSHIVALSTGCVYSFTTPDTGGSTEESEVAPPGEYAQSCLQREQAFTRGSLRHCTPVSLIRLNYAIEPRYGVLVDIARKVLSGQPVDVTMGYVNVIWQGDALNHIVQSLSLASSPPTILNVTGSHILKVRDLAQGFAKRFGKPALITGQEAPTAWLNNASKSHQLFGPPAVSVDQMMDWIADWLQRDMPTLDKPTHFEVRSGGY